MLFNDQEWNIFFKFKFKFRFKFKCYLILKTEIMIVVVQDNENSRKDSKMLDEKGLFVTKRFQDANNKIPINDSKILSWQHLSKYIIQGRQRNKQI